MKTIISIYVVLLGVGAAANTHVNFDLLSAQKIQTDSICVPTNQGTQAALTMCNAIDKAIHLMSNDNILFRTSGCQMSNECGGIQYKLDVTAIILN